MSVPRLMRAGDAGFCTVVVARERGGREGGGGGSDCEEVDSSEKETDLWACSQDASSVATMLTTTEAKILKRTLY
jgi:hypothetical protein